jgi:hypothetical protein
MSALGAVDPIANPEWWDVITIGDTVSPGLCEVGEFTRRHEWDTKKGKGTFGSTITFTGRPPAKGSIKFFLWDNGTLGSGRNHFEEWDAFLPLLKYDPTKQSVQAVQIFHPSLDAIDVHQAVTESIGNVVNEGGLGSGLYSITVEFLEFFPPPPVSAVSTPTRADTSTNPDTPGDPPDPVADAQQAEIANLLAQAAQP